MTLPHPAPHGDDHPQDGGFAEDLTRLFSRRRALGALALLAGGAGAGLVALRGAPGQAEPTLAATGADGALCVKAPEETAGPFPGDGSNAREGRIVNVLAEAGVIRSDLRPSFAGLLPVAEGVALDLAIRLVDVAAGCRALPGLALYLWHCDAEGHYSLYTRPEANYLRGMQISDNEGMLRFATILPGAYDGRWPHLHFEVYASAEAAVAGERPLLTSQFAVPEAVAAPIYATDPRYAGSAVNLARVTLARDNVFGDNTPEQIAAQTPEMVGGAGGLSGRVTVALTV